MKIKISSLISLFFPPCRLKNWLLNNLGWRIEKDVRVGWSYISAQHVVLSKGSMVGHGNYIRVDRLHLGECAYVQSLNQIKGPLVVVLDKRAAIGNLNKIIRAPLPISWGHSMLKLGELSKITSKHTIDCMRPVVFGDFSTLAGHSSQIWTHGFMHAPSGEDRYRVDGSIRVGDNVYIGSGSIINPGIRIGNGVTVGSNSSVSKSLLKAGLYVNQPLRFIALDYKKGLEKYPVIQTHESNNKVLHKKI